jgi:hypothetical protein
MTKKENAFLHNNYSMIIGKKHRKWSVLFHVETLDLPYAIQFPSLKTIECKTRLNKDIFFI